MFTQDHGRRRALISMAAVFAVITTAVVGITTAAGADPAPPEWTRGTPFVESGQYAIPLVSADAGPSGTLLAFRRTVPGTGDGVRYGLAPSDGSPVNWIDPLPGKKATFIRVAADAATGDAAVVYWVSPPAVGGWNPFVPPAIVTYSAATGTWTSPRDLPVTSSDLLGDQRQLVVSGGAAHLLWSANEHLGLQSYKPIGLDVHRAAVAGGPVTTHALARWSSNGPSQQVNSGSTASGVLDTPHARLEAAPDGSLHAVWTRAQLTLVSGVVDPRQTSMTTHAARTATTGTTWTEPSAVAAASLVANRYVELLRGPEGLSLVEQSVTDTTPGAAEASWTTVTRASRLDASGPGTPVEVSSEPNASSPTNRTWVPTPDSRRDRVGLSALDNTRLLVADANATGGVRQLATPPSFVVDTTFRPVVGLDRFDRLWTMGVCAEAPGRCLARWDDDVQQWIDEGTIALSFGISPWSGDLLPSGNDRGLVVVGHTAEPLQNLATYFPPGFVPPTSSPEPTPTESGTPSTSPEPTGSPTGEASPTPSATEGTPTSEPTTEPTVEPSVTQEPTPSVSSPPASPSPSTTTETPLPLPPAPSALRAVARDARVGLFWTTSGGAPLHTPATGVVVTVSPATTTGARTFVLPPGTSGTTVPGLRNGAAYTFHVRLRTASGDTARSGLVAARPIGAPSRPGAFAAKPLAKGRTALSWNAAASTGARPVAGYKVYVNGVYAKTLFGRTSVRWTHSGERKGRTYRYKVFAYNPIGFSTTLTLTKKRR